MKLLYTGLLSSTLTLMGLSGIAQAAEEWDVTLGIQGMTGDYSDSETRDKKKSYGLFVSADYLDSWGMTFVYDKGDYDFKNNPSYPIGNNLFTGQNIDQDSYYLSGRTKFRPDQLNGVLTLSLDMFHIDNDDKSKLSDNVKVYGAHLAYLNYDQDFYLDLGYENSDYYKGLTIDQWTPTVGFAFNDQKDWLQLRGYFISSNKKSRTQNKSSSEAVDISLTHFFDGQMFNLTKLKGSVLAGERFYTVDRDAAAVYNLDDFQRGGTFSLLAEFALTESVKLTVSGGRERYRNKNINDDYNSTYLYTSLSTSW